MTLFKEIIKKAKMAQAEYALLSFEQRKRVLKSLLDQLQQNEALILGENKKDVAELAVSDPKADRLLLNSNRLQGMQGSIMKVLQVKDPLNQLLETYDHPQGMKLYRITVPLGLVGMIYESRPNVTIDAFVLSFFSGNACILKGGHEADASNEVLIKLIHAALEQNNINTDGVVLLPSQRHSVSQMCKSKLLDVIIPRGGKKLIEEVRKQSRVPVIETGAGVVHLYFEASGDKEVGRKVLTNAKTRRVSVCNAVDCLIIHKKRLDDLPYLVEDLAKQQVELFADAPSFAALENKYPAHLLHRATKESYGTEFLSLKLAIKSVSSLSRALKHIAKYSSKHSEAIISENKKSVSTFMKSVDAACVYANVSTAFTDGEEFGMGAEIGISTQKLHVRGPFSTQHLTTSKWVIYGEGQVRS